MLWSQVRDIIPICWGDTMKKHYLLLLVIYIIFIALGLPDALLGSAWNLIREDLQTSLSTLGFMTIAVYSMSVFATFNAPRLMRWMETKVITLISVSFTGVALILISQVSEFYQMLFFAIPLGLGAGAIDVSLNHYLAANYKAKHMNYLHSFYGIGVTLGPTIMAYTLSQNSWRLGYIVVGSLLLVIAIIAFFSRNLWKKEHQEERNSTHAPVTLKAIFQTKGAVLSILIFLFYVHLESLGGVWIASYFYIEKEVSYAIAALFTTTYYGALTVGRVTSGVFSSRLRPQAMVLIGQLLILLAGIGMLIPNPPIVVSFVIVFLFGLGCAPIYPNMMYLNSVYFDRQKMSKIMSLQMAIGYMGFGLLTPLAGLFFDRVSISFYPLFITGVALILFFVTTTLMRQKANDLINTD